MGLQADYRGAAVSILTAVAASAGVKLQVYRARPASLFTPTAFVDSMEDDLTDFLASAIFQHVPTVNIVCLWGLFDSGDAVDQRDLFVDAFHSYIRSNYHAAGGNTLIRPDLLQDDPGYVPDWIQPISGRPSTYYATRITLKGDATD